MLMTIVLFFLAAWGVMSVIVSINNSQRRARQRADIEERLYEMERDNYPPEYRKQVIAAMRERHRFENL